MKRFCLLMVGILFLGVITVYAQTNQEVTIRVNWVPADGLVNNGLAKKDRMEVVMFGMSSNNGTIMTLYWRESKEVSLPLKANEEYKIYVMINNGNFNSGRYTRSEQNISIYANSGRVVLNATPRLKGVLLDPIIDLVNATPKSQPQSVTQQPQAQTPAPTQQQAQPQQQAQNTQQQAWAAYDRGDAALDAGNYDRAIAEFTEAIRLNPNHADAYFKRGNVYLMMGKPDNDRAIAEYTHAIRLDPNYSAAYYNRSVAYNNKGDYDRAIADCTQAIKLDPNNSEAYNNRGYSYTQKNDFSRAIADFEAAVRLAPNNSQARDNLALARQAQQQQNQPQAQNVDLGTLVREIDNNSARASHFYNNKTLRLSGVVYMISDDLLWLAVSSFDHMNIVVQLNSTERTKLINLNKWQTVTVRGVYDGSMERLRRAIIE